MANTANPYYVEPFGGLDIGARVAHVIEAGKQYSRQKKFQEEAPGVMQSGDPQQIADFMIEYPEMSQTMINAVATKNQMDERALSQSAQNIITSGEGDVEWAKKVMAFTDPQGLQAYMKATGEPATSGKPAEVQTFEYLLSGLSEEDAARARRVKLGLDPRATESAVQKAKKSFATEKGKLEARLGLEPQVAGAVAAAKNEAKATADEIATKKSNQTAWDVYNNSMSNLAQAMAGTETGPIAGFVPAVTSNQQIAEGAVAVMAPVLKQMFRAAGEGVFTDKDQELLMKMVPTRKDTPEARAAKIAGIDAVVRAKLGMGTPQQAPQQLPQGVSEDQLKFTMDKYGMTREEVLSRLGAEQQLPQGVSEEQVKFTMDKYGMTREEVLSRLGAK